jgi:hypothetical protein
MPANGGRRNGSLTIADTASPALILKLACRQNRLILGDQLDDDAGSMPL